MAVCFVIHDYINYFYYFTTAHVTVKIIRFFKPFCTDLRSNVCFSIQYTVYYTIYYYFTSAGCVVNNKFHDSAQTSVSSDHYLDTEPLQYVHLPNVIEVNKMHHCHYYE